MSLETIRPYFKEAFLAMDKKLTEWDDDQQESNVPNSVLENKYLIGIGAGTLVSFNQYCLVMQVTVGVKLWTKGFRSPIEAVDSGSKKVEAVIKEACRHSRRLNQPFIKNVVPTGFNVEAIGPTNDNITRSTVNFTVTIHIDLQT